ncbi:MAG TPA: hypothetical protein VF855_08890 [Acidimicrobiales bacterium]
MSENHDPTHDPSSAEWVPTEAEARDLPLVKISGQPVIANLPFTVGEDLFVLVELVNLGTAPSHAGQNLAIMCCTRGAQVTDASIDLGEHVVEPNGGSLKHVFHIDQRFFHLPGEWEVFAVIADGYNMGWADEQVVRFTVEPRATLEG